MFDAQAFTNERNAHVLVVVAAHELVILMRNLGADHPAYEVTHLSDRVAESAPLALVMKVRDDALTSLLGTRRRAADTVEALDAVVLRDDAAHADGARAAWRTVLMDKLVVCDVEDTRNDGYRLGRAFAAFEAVYDAPVPVPPVPPLYLNNSQEFTSEFERARREYKPDETTCHC